MHIDDWSPEEHGGPAQKAAIDRAFHHIELGLAQDDPDFVRRVRRLQRSDVVHAIAVFLLLAVGAVLLVVGLATQTWATWLAGGSAFLCSFAVDACYQRSIGRAING